MKKNAGLIQKSERHGVKKAHVFKPSLA